MTMRAQILLSAAIVCLPLSLIPRAAQRASATVVHVWKVGSPHRGDSPVPGIPPLLDTEAHRRGFALDMRVLAAKDLRARFSRPVALTALSQRRLSKW